MAVTVPAGAAPLLAGGGLALLPTDTVYGIACAAADVDACRRLYALKQRPATQATAAVLGSVPALLELLPEMGSRAFAACRVLLPGPYTLVVPNPAGRLAHLCGDAPDRIGLRVPLLDSGVADLADEAGGLLMTSANLRGGPDPSLLGQVPKQLREAAAFEVDGGQLDGVPSTVIDVTGPQPRVLRDGPGLERALELLR
ncbi:MAG TPA: Sua5/YciO/YrdC/YwlC family protein [Gaiellales bacterium]|nr:Sua5/YciO/YrdC/YwlC family protein [Gaiellales bacterium]